jgi:hypothetical membrane protein
MARMKALASALLRHAAVLATVLFAVSAIGFGARVDGYSHSQHPLALLGAAPVSHALAFNLLAFVLPGALVASVAVRLRRRLAGSGDPRALRWSARIGAQLLLIAALVFAVQGLLPLDASDLEGVRSSRHAAAWMVWLIAFVAGGVLFGVGMRRAPSWRAMATTTLAAAFATPLLAIVLPGVVSAGIAQRLAVALWFAWAILAGALVARRGRQP